MTGLKERQLFESFINKDYRDAFVDEHISSGLARQIRAIREKYGWTQQELAERTGKAQETISQLENPDYGRFTLKTLKTLASAFDLALMVNFVSLSELINRVSNLSPSVIAPPNYEEERQMSFDEAPGGSSEWKVSVASSNIPDISGEATYWYVSTLLGSSKSEIAGSTLEIDSTGDVLVRSVVSRPETGKEQRDFALAA